MMWADEHDWKKYPELTSVQLQEFGFLSPHEQITEDFSATVLRVHDGDTCTLVCDFRDFKFPLRFTNIDAPELNTGTPGEESRDFLKGLIEGEDVMIKIDKNKRVDKYGRLLGEVLVGGQAVGEIMLQFGYAKEFVNRYEDLIPDFEKSMGEQKWA